MSVLSNLKNFFSNLRKSNLSNTNEYTDLAPVDNMENGEEYLNALDWAFTNKRVKNIALAGPYGSGKSSIIESYLKTHPRIRKKSIRISMATFIERGIDENGHPKQIDISSDEIEVGILKQLFYKVNYKEIPQSRYRKLHRVSWKYIWGYLVVVFFFLAGFGYIFLPDIFSVMLENIILAGSKLTFSPVISTLLFSGFLASFLAVIAYFCRSTLAKIKVTEVKLPTDTTIKQGAETSDTVFNKNIDELVYFFEETNYRVVFFEDLDRLSQTKVFVQLRELNTLLNNDDTIKDPIIFVYAIKDDIFIDTDRTKFFDFIIPVVPIINATNSGEILLEKLKASKDLDIEHEISQAFVLDISPFIEDMRILQNIYNEFIVYKNTLRIEQELILSDEMMMAIIIFKNICPCDFADIQQERGIIKQAFKDKTDYIKKRQSAVSKEKVELEKKLSQYKTDALKSMKEIKLAFLAELTNWQGIATDIGGNRILEFLEDSFDFYSLSSIKNPHINYHTWTNNYQSRSISNFQQKVTPYLDRCAAIKLVEERGISDIQEEMERIRKESTMLSTRSLRYLLENYAVNEILNESVRENKLLVYLLRRGYIDERYATYINYFKGNSITKDDMNFILAVKNHDNLPFAYPLTKTAMVVQRLQDYEFEQRAIYNFTLLDQLLSDNTQSNKLNVVVCQLANGNDDSWAFINEFIDLTQQKEKFIQTLSAKWAGMWDYIANDVTLTYERQLTYLELLLTEAAAESLLLLNSQNNIRVFFEAHSDILQKLNHIAPEYVIAAIRALEISFSDICIDTACNEVLTFIFDNAHYELNSKMVERIIEFKKPDILYQVSTQNYTSVNNLGYAPLLDNIHQQIHRYIEEIVLTPSNKNEELPYIVDMLERVVVDADLCLQIIKHQHAIFNTFDECAGRLVPNQKKNICLLWDALLMSEKISLNWANVVAYWNIYGFTQSLVQYIESHVDMLSSMDSTPTEADFREAFIVCGIGDEAFKCLLPVLPLEQFAVEFTAIPENRILIMLKSHYFKFDIAQYNRLEEVYPNLCTTFIIENQSDYMSVHQDIMVDTALFETLILHPELNMLYAQKLFDLYGITHLTDDVAMQVCIKQFKLNVDQFKAVWDHLDDSGKNNLMLSYLDILNADDFETCFSQLPNIYPNFINRDYRRDVKINDTAANQQLLKRLETVGYITSYAQDVRKAFNPTTNTDKGSGLLVARIKATR